MKKRKHEGTSPADSFLILGIGNHVVFLLIFSLGCITSDFQCSGGSMGGIMMVYALSLFMPQLAIEVVVAVALFFIVVTGSILDAKKILVLLFIITFMLVIAASRA